MRSGSCVSWGASFALWRSGSGLCVSVYLLRHVRGAAALLWPLAAVSCAVLWSAFAAATFHMPMLRFICVFTPFLDSPIIYIQTVYSPLLRRFSARGSYLCGGARIASRNFYPVLPPIVVYPDDRKASEGLFGSRRLFLRFL